MAQYVTDGRVLWVYRKDLIRSLREYEMHYNTPTEDIGLHSVGLDYQRKTEIADVVIFRDDAFHGNKTKLLKSRY